MIDSSKYKNRLVLRDNPDPLTRREDLTKEVLRDASLLPRTVEYQDIDEAFKEWCKENTKVFFEGKEVPTFALYANQRFSEYMQMWQNSDENRNNMMNFKIITRENNPKFGSIYGQAHNVPGEPLFLMKRFTAVNNNGNRCYVDYKMKQPVPIDLTYSISIVTNKYELINEMNLIINEQFKGIQAYIRPNGHFMPMKLANISDESEYNLSDRQYFSQTFNITVSAYILREDDFVEEEVPVVNVVCIGDGESSKRGGRAVIEDIDEPKSEFETTKITVDFENCDKFESKFNIDCDLVVTKIEMKNVRKLTLYLNDSEFGIYTRLGVLEPTFDNLNIRTAEGDGIKLKIKKINILKKAQVNIYGYNPNEVSEKQP